MLLMEVNMQTSQRQAAVCLGGKWIPHHAPLASPGHMNRRNAGGAVKKHECQKGHTYRWITPALDKYTVYMKSHHVPLEFCLQSFTTFNQSRFNAAFPFVSEVT
ncbi:hypothetical protein PAMP_014469 [Pampus punctatissimus]